jgi:hypothetical protein
MQRTNMRALLIICCSLATLAPAAPEAGPVHLSMPAVRTELVRVVASQLSAFRKDDWKKAYALAAPSFRSVVSPQSFVTLITRNYAVVHHNTRAEFGIPSDNGRVAIVPVRIFSRDDSEPYTWLLVKVDGVWLITGVVPQRATPGA